MPTQREARRDAAVALATLAILTVAVFALYGRSLDAPFIFDDRTAILENSSIRRLWPPIGNTAMRGPLNPPPLAPTARRPLANLTLALDYSVGGLDPTGYRFVNLGLHVLTAAVLAAIVRRTLRLAYFAPAIRSVAAPLALVVALLWAVHPLGSEAVVYVTQRTELLGALFYLTTLWAALRHWAAPSTSARRAWVLGAGLACVAGMASKEVVASVPLAVLLYERTFLVESWPAVRRSWPLHLTLALGWIVLVALSVGGVSGLADARHHIPVLVWWMTQAKVVLLYLKLAVWPWPLTIHYAPRFLRSVADAWPWLAGAALVATAVIAAVWRRPAARFVAIAAVLVLAPTLVIPLPKMMAAERRMYLPLAGLVALAVVGTYRWLAVRDGQAAIRGGQAVMRGGQAAIGGGHAAMRGRPAVAAGAATVLVLVLAGVTSVRLQAYDSVETIWRDAVRRQPDDPMAHYNLGVALLDAHRPPAETLPSFEEALRLDPDYPSALDNLGMTLNRLGRSQDAQAPLERALALEPDDVVAHNNLGIALTKTGHADEALVHLQRALELEPEQPKAKVHVNLGNALLALGRVDDAIGHFERAAALGPEDADARYNLGGALMQVGRTPEAIAAFEQALRLAPDDVETLNNLGSALLRDGRTDRAVEVFRRALVLRPDNPNVLANLGTALLVAGRRDEAMTQLEHAIRVSPDHVNARRNLARALLEAGRPDDAATQFEHALRLDPNDAQARFACARAYAQTDRQADARAMANAALTLAHSQGQAALADEIAAWLHGR